MAGIANDSSQDLALRGNILINISKDVRYQDLGLMVSIACLTYWVVLVVYRLYFSPIAKFPGPKLAAATHWYEFYYQIVKDGQFRYAVQRMHDKYGPIVRVNPWELSIRDSSFYGELFVAGSTRRTDMWARGREGNGFQNTHHLSVPHDLHRQKRKQLEPFFSRQSIARIEEAIASKVRVLDEQLQSLKNTNTVVSSNCAFMALTGDIIGHVTCGTNPGLVEDSRFAPEWHQLLNKTVLMGPLFKSFPWLNSLLQLIPASIMERMYPRGISNMMVGKIGMEYIEKIKSQIRNSDMDSKDHNKSLFHYFLTSDIPDSEKSSARLQSESLLFLIAGTFSSAHTLSNIMYYVLADPAIKNRLRDELKDVMACYPEKYPRWADLEKVSYLKACIREGLRLSGLVGNIARCSPDVALQYKEWTIPKHTPVGMSIYAMHTDPEVFPEPLKFLPERWLGDYNPLMNRNFVPFTKGSRSCIGINLANAELYFTIAILFRPGAPELTLFETEECDVLPVRDYIIGLPRPESKGVRVLVN
ncbi:cytochrome P450 [Biscogniauxia sp. FL1348]|nr:cytochrome P450 [Biscogniauxia sp. FL1348]